LLSEPIESSIFETRKPLSLKAFKKRIVNKTLKLNSKTRMLFIKNNFYVNGEFLKIDKKYTLFLKQLANDREISFESTLNKSDLNALGIVLLPLYVAGFVDFIQ